MPHSLPSTLIAPRFPGGQQIEFLERPTPEPGPGEVLIRVAANVLCGSDGYAYRDGCPVTPGHEVTGEIVAVGPGGSVQPGANGVVFLMQYCGACRSCGVSATNQCLSKRGDIGFNRDGGYQPYIVVGENTFYQTDLRGRDATLLLDVMGTGGHAISRAQLVHKDMENAVIIGAGPVGLAVLCMLKIRMGADFPVAISDVTPYRLKLAEQLGGVPINVSEGPLLAGLQKAGFGWMDAAFDSAGRTEAREEAMQVLAPRGVMVLVGHGGSIAIDASFGLIIPERAVLGSEYFRFDEFAANYDALQQHRSYLNQIITHVYPQDGLREAFRLFFSGQSGKIAIEHHA